MAIRWTRRLTGWIGALLCVGAVMPTVWGAHAADDPSAEPEPSRRIGRALPRIPLTPREPRAPGVAQAINEGEATIEAIEASEVPNEEGEAPIEASEAPTLSPGMSKMFHLRNGNLFEGTIQSISEEGAVTLETMDGTLDIPASDFLTETADITKTNGTRYRGEILAEDTLGFSLLTEYGEIVVNKSDIRTMDRFLAGRRVAEREERMRFFQGEETLTHVFLDPTSFGLPERTFYITGISLGFGFTDSFMLSTRMFDSAQGDVNLQGHFRLLNWKRASTELGVGIGGRLSTRHDMRREYQRYSHFIEHNGERFDDLEDRPPIEDLMVNSLERPNSKVFSTMYGVVSWRGSLPSARGKWGIHLGAQTNSLAWQDLPPLKDGSVWKIDGKERDRVFPYRVWAALDYDMTKRVKFLVEVFADNGWRWMDFEDVWKDYLDKDDPGVLSFERGTYRPVDIDLGFLVAPFDSFRIGAHFQNPYVTFYWKLHQF